MKITFTIFFTLLLSLTVFSQENILINGKGEVKENVVKLYPNPAIDYMTVSILNNTLKNPQVSVYSIIGNKIQVDIEEHENHLFLIDLRNFTAGYYLLVIKDPDVKFNKTYKFLKRE